MYTQDKDDYERIMLDYEPLIKKCIKLYIHDPSYFEDAMQEGRLTILKCIKSFDPSSGSYFPAYVKSSVIYTLRDFTRKLPKDLSIDEKPAGSFKDYNSFEDMLPSPEDTALDYERKASLKQLYEYVERLPDKQKAIIKSYYFNRVPLREIALNRRCCYKAVCQMKARALKNLKGMYDEA